LTAEEQCTHLYDGNYLCHRVRGHTGDHHCDGSDMLLCVLKCLADDQPKAAQLRS